MTINTAENPGAITPSGGWKKIIFAAVVFCVLIIVLAIFGIADWINPYDDRRFDSVLWQSSNDVRMSMADDLLANHLVLGMTEDQVEVMLGAPDDQGWFHQTDVNAAFSADMTFQYYLGNDSFGKGDDVFLYVHFDDNMGLKLSEIVGF